jgi:hypothetical protein
MININGLFTSRYINIIIIVTYNSVTALLLPETKRILCLSKAVNSDEDQQKGLFALMPPIVRQHQDVVESAVVDTSLPVRLRAMPKPVLGEGLAHIRLRHQRLCSQPCGKYTYCNNDRPPQQSLRLTALAHRQPRMLLLP